MILCLRALIIFVCCFFAPALSYSKALPRLIPYREGDRWGYADTTGFIRIRPQWHSAGLFHNNRAIVTVPGKERNITFCLIDTNGNYLIPPVRHWNGTYDALNSYDARKHWGMIDSTGVLLLPYEYDAPPAPIRLYGDGQSLITLSRKGVLGIASPHGTVLLPPLYQTILPVYNTSQHLAMLLAQKGKQWLLINDSFGEVAAQVCDSMWVIDGANGWMGFAQNDRRGIISRDGRIVVPAAYEEAAPMNNSAGGAYFLVRTADGYGVVDDKGKRIIDTRYKERPSRYTDGNFRVVEPVGKDYRVSVVSPQGKVLLPPVQGEVLVYPDSVVLVRSLGLVDSGRRHYLRQSIQQLDPLTYKPRGQAHFTTKKTDWEFPFLQPQMCGTGAYESRVLEQLRPKYFKKNQFAEFKGFDHGGRYWAATGYVLLNDSLRCYAVTSNNDGRPYTAVVDENNRFVLGPFEGGSIYSGNIAQNELLVRYSANNSYMLTDTGFRPLSPKIPYKIKVALRRIGSLRYLAEVPEHAYRPAPEVRTALQKAQRRQDKSLAMAYTSYVIERIIDDTGACVRALEPYWIQGVCDSAGAWKQMGGNDRLLLVTDSNLTQGILDPDGAIMYPQLSFHYASLATGSHLNITAGNQTPLFLATDSAGYCGLVNTKNQIVYPQVSFHHRKKVKLWDWNLVFFPDEQALVDSLNQALIPGASELRIANATSDKILVQSTQNIAGLYTCSYKDSSGQYFQVYIDRNGRVYGKD
ncbi:WG repeat-containing protein [Taibaiella koreensis]|uniref:WG repeat-containing protein n=1 Tax=Taibaiella koreensis TaxID=1268548 RepID=UPI000E59F038|nr:WG repeat-containing protein [Taibaiella koreensis]